VLRKVRKKLDKVGRKINVSFVRVTVVFFLDSASLKLTPNH